MTFTAAGDSAVVGEIAAHQSTAHHRRTAGISVAHLGGSQGACSTVRLLLLLVTAGNDEHGSTIRGSNTNSTDTDSSSGSFLDRGLLGAVVVAAEGVVGVVGGRGRRRAVITGKTAIILHAWNDLDGGINVLRKVIDEGVRVVVNGRVGDLDIHAQCVNHASGVIELGERGDVAESLRRIVWDELRHLNLVDINANRIRQSLGQESEDLGSCIGILADVLVILAVQETDLEKHRVLGLFNIGVRSTNNLGQVGRQRNCRRGSQSLRGRAERGRLLHDDDTREP